MMKYLKSIKNSIIQHKLCYNFAIVYFILILPALLLSSCKKVSNNPIEHFSKLQDQKLIHSKIFSLEDFDVLQPSDAIKINNSYMIWDNSNGSLFNLINFNTKENIKGIKKGNGPGELISPSSLQLVDGSFYIFDVAKKDINKIEISDTELSLKQELIVKSDNRIFMVNYQEKRVVTTGIFEDYWLKVIDEEGEITSYVDFPFLEETNDIPKISQSILYISTHMSTSPNKQKMVVATQPFGLISFFNNKESILSEYKQIKYFGPKYSIQAGGAIAYNRDNKIGFCALDCDDKYVYALYSGRTYTEFEMLNHHCQHLLVYDWDGNPIKHYLLDIPLTSMKYDKENNSIYGIAYNPEGVFVEYEL